jgi:uncharacterized protein (DUF1778 family)
MSKSDRVRRKPTRKGTEIKFRVASEDKRLMRQAAHARGLSLSAWLRMIALEAAHPPRRGRRRAGAR